MRSSRPPTWRGPTRPPPRRASPPDPGRTKAQLAQDQPPSPKTIRPSHDGQPTASCCQRRPAPTQCTWRAAPAPHTTRGSSALATTCVCGAAAKAARQLPAIMRTSFVRSSWSRDRFSNSTVVAAVAVRTRGRYTSSVSRTARRAGEPLSAATWPGGMFEPVSLLTTASPVAPSATVSSLVVVVFPLVPVTRATWRPALRCSSSRGSNRRPARPPATVPWPRPRRREAALTARVVALASCALTEGVCCGPAPRPSARGAPWPRGAAMQ